MLNDTIIKNSMHVVNSVKTIATHHKQLTQAKGELFNIYNILNLKTKEVRTHSAFIAELLNPKGTHFMGTAFLNSFLDLISEDIKKHLDIDSTSVLIEYSIGVINKEYKTGGRIDILLKDVEGYSVCIENKIDAGDQEEQIERYCNYNKGKNKVVYLSKFGEGPAVTSKGEKSTINDDFIVISYQNHIISWLESCQTIAYDQPILRESIKQYKILIQQITNTLGDKQDKELREVVIHNLEEASLIASKYYHVKNELKDSFRKKVKEYLKEANVGYSISTKKNCNSPFASIWLNSEKSELKQRWFGVESFSGFGHLNGTLFVGVFDKKGIALNENYNPLRGSWIHHQVLTYDNIEVNLESHEFLQKIHTQEQLKIVARNISDQINSFIKENDNLLN